jgi:hypothetical protein
MQGQVHLASFFTDCVVDDNDRQIHVEGISAIPPVSEAIIN